MNNPQIFRFDSTQWHGIVVSGCRHLAIRLVQLSSYRFKNKFRLYQNKL